MTYIFDISMGKLSCQYPVQKYGIIAYLIGMKQDGVRTVLAQNIKIRRKALGITQAKLAELAEISEPYMNDIERCQTWVSDKTLAKLAWALNIEIHELFVETSEPAEKSIKKQEMYLLFQQRKQEMHDFIEKSFETLLREVVR